MPRVIDARALDPAVLDAAAERLARGQLVAFPTETVYGLGARADQADAVAQIFAAKGRPADHPLIVHVADAADVAEFASEVPAFAARLIEAFWPGPLTLILPRRLDRCAAAAGGQSSIGLRCPDHPVAQALLRAARTRGAAGIAAPSANRFGRVSPTCAAHVVDEFPDRPDLWVLDGGDCAVGIESAIVDCSRGHPVLLRPGGLGAAQIEAAAGEALRAADAQAPRASGTLSSHYAPRAAVRLLSRDELAARLRALAATQSGNTLGVYSLSIMTDTATSAALPGLRWRVMPPDAASTAHQLFAVLRALDAHGVAEIWIETPPDLPAWDGVRDRLTRAATR